MPRERLGIVAALALTLGWVGEPGACEPGIGRVARVEQAPVIDGELREACWGAPAAFTRFVSVLPIAGREPSQPTRLALAYDGEHLYAAFRCEDSEPHRIRSHVCRRDEGFSDDWVGLYINEESASRGAAELFVNPHGCPMDALQTAQGDDISVDFPFFTAARRDEGGWTAEMAIPFRILRLPEGPDACIRLIALRHIGRTGEQVLFPALDIRRHDWKARGVRLAFQGIHGSRAMDLETVVTASERLDPEVGGSAHIGLGGDVRLDVTWKPDFSQVEADAPQVDINRRFPVWFPEKRPFFLTGREIFVLAGEGGTVVRAFHSRTIERPLLGARLTSRHIGALFALDRVTGLRRWGAGDGSEGLAPVGVVRAQFEPDPACALGFLAAALESGDDHNRVAGADADWRIGGTVRIECHTLRSHTREGPGPSRTGHAETLIVGIRDRNSDIQAQASQVSPDFRLDIGCLERAALRSLRVGYRHTLSEVQSWLTLVRPGLQRHLQWTWAGERSEDESRLSLYLDLPGSAWAEGVRYEGGQRYAGRWFTTRGWRWAIGGRWLPGGEWGFSRTRRHAPRYHPGSPLAGTHRNVTAQIEIRPRDWATAHAVWSRDSFQGRSPAGLSTRQTVAQGRLTVQPGASIGFRATVTWVREKGRFTSDLVATVRPGESAVMHLGWGSLHQREPGSDAASFQRVLFFKTAWIIHG